MIHTLHPQKKRAISPWLVQEATRARTGWAVKYVLEETSSDLNVEEQPAQDAVFSIPPCKIEGADIRYASCILGQLRAAREMQSTDEEPRATQVAYEQAKSTIVEAMIECGLEKRQIPKGYVSTDSEGGIRIEWLCPSARVVMVNRAKQDQNGYIYCRTDSKSGTFPTTGFYLAKALKNIVD